MDEQLTTYGIIGNPVKHSLSPSMHNAAFKALDVPAKYDLFPLEEAELEDFFAKLREKDSSIFGFNVTVPYKQSVLQFCDSLSPFAKKIGAVNTIAISEDRKLIGFNTDGPGFLAHLAELNFNPDGKNIAIMGAGGSARSIIATLCTVPEKPASIKIYNRTTVRVDSLLDDLKERMDVGIVSNVMSIDDLEIRSADLLINTTSVGLNEEDPILVEDELFHPDLFVYDLIYNPAETLLLRMAKENGARVANGLGMLYYQGVLAFQHWADTDIEEEVKLKMREALEEAAGL